MSTTVSVVDIMAALK